VYTVRVDSRLCTVSTACKRPIHGRIHLYTVCLYSRAHGRGHVRVHGPYTLVHDHVHGRVVVDDPVHGLYRLCTSRVHGRINGFTARVYGPYRAVYTCTQCAYTAVYTTVHQYTVYTVRVHSRVYTTRTWPCTRSCSRSVYTAVCGPCTRDTTVYEPCTRVVYIHSGVHDPCTYTRPCTRSLRCVHGRVHLYTAL